MEHKRKVLIMTIASESIAQKWLPRMFPTTMNSKNGMSVTGIMHVIRVH